MNLMELRRKLQSIRDRGFVPSLRRGPTGVGYTLEILLGVSESNLPLPDVGRVEIKATRKNSQSLITLFTFNRNVWCLPQQEVIRRFGYQNSKGRLALKNTFFYGRPTHQGLVLGINASSGKIFLVDSMRGENIAIWDLYLIVGKFISKLEKVLFVLADTRKSEEEKELFHYNKAYLLSNPEPRKFIDGFKDGIIGIDLRMHLMRSGRVRNRGTAFRVRESELFRLYGKRVELI